MNKHLRRGTVALAIVIACVAGMTSPAAPWTILTGDITGGTVTLISPGGTVTDTIPLGGTGATGTGCSTSIGVHIDFFGWIVSTHTVVSRFQLGTTHYIVESTKTTSTTLNTPGTVTSITTTSASLNTSGLNLLVNIYPPTNTSSTATDCAHGTTRVCRFSSVALSIQGTYNGDWNNPAVSDTVNLSATGTLGATSPPCSAPFTSYTNGTVTIAGLTGHITGVA